MFSQSLLIGENTLQELEKNACEKQQPQKRKQESLDVIDESPTHSTNNNITCRSMRMRFESIKTQKKSLRKKGIKRNKSDSILNTSTGSVSQTSKTENYSEFFRSEIDYEFQQQIDAQAAGKPAANNSIICSLDKYFKDSFDFDMNKIQSPTNVPPLVEKDGLSTEKNAFKNVMPTENELNAMFDKSDFFTQQNDSTIYNNDILDMPISVADLSDTSFKDCNVAIIEKVEPSENPVNIVWEDSVEFNDIITHLHESNVQSINKPHTETNLMVEDSVALGIDNVTFTQNFLKQKSFENDLNMHGSTEKSVQQFINEEIDLCSESVINAVTAQEPVLNESIKLNITANSLSSSNIVLNWSSDSLPNEHKMPDAKKQGTVPNTNNIGDWGLTKSIVEEYNRKGIRTMFEWQVECLSNTRVLFNRANLVYSAPTSAGKTLVSELLMIKNVLEFKKKSLFILPFISVVREKMFYLKDLLAPAGLCVEGFFGGYTPPCGFDRVDIALCTIEKANSIINKLLENQKIDQLGCIVVDEIHLISDPGRGYILELLIAKVLYVCEHYGHRIQIIAMSATLPNLNLLTKWLKAEFYLTNFRPVALEEMIKIDNTIYDAQMKQIRVLNVADYAQYQKDPEGLGQLCIETILEGCSVIIFCPSKDWCEALCRHVASFIYSVGKNKGSSVGELIRKNLNMDFIEETKLQLRNCETGLDSALEQSISYGCAFHHAGLTTDERDIIESGFKSGSLRVLVATSTISSGVNLPARRVIIRTPMFGGKPMNSLTYKQMIGRAGRMGKDTLGESILICGNGQLTVGKNLIGAKLKPLTSCLAADSHVNLKRAILEIIASGMAKTVTDLEQFTNCTLLASEHGICFKYDTNINSFSANTRQNKSQSVQNAKNSSIHDTTNGDNEFDPISSCMQFLIKYEFIRMQLNEDTNEMNFMATRLGTACLASSMPPGDGFLLFSELQKSRQCFVLDSELHAVYLVTPFSVCYQITDIDWMFFLDMWEKLPSEMRRVGEIVGVKESFLVKAVRGHKLDFKALQIHKRFYTALALQELVNEIHVNVVAVKFKCSRGLLQSLQQMASTFAGVVTSFCHALQWNMLALIISQFKERLFFGVHRDLIDLMKISNLNGQRARAIFDAGYTNITELAKADVFTIEKILYNSMSFDSKLRDGENKYDAIKRNTIRYLHITGKSGITIRDAAKLIIEDARKYLQLEMGIDHISWEQLTDSDACENEKSSDKKEINLNKTTQKEVIDNKENQIPAKCSKQVIVESEDIFESPETKKTLNVKKPIPKKNLNKKPQMNTSIESSDEIQQTPKTEQKTQSRFLRSLKTNNTQQRHARRKNDAKLQVSFVVENPMINQLIVNDMDSIELSQNDITKSSKNLVDSNLEQPNLCINEVFENEESFIGFEDKLRNSSDIALAVGVSENLSLAKITTIGGHLLQNENMCSKLNCTFENLYIDGIAVCFNEANTCWYLNLQNGPGIPLEKRIQFVENLFTRCNLTIKMVDAKDQLKILAKIGIDTINVKFEDPRVAQWLLRPDNPASFKEMVEKYAPKCLRPIEFAGISTCSAISLNYSSTISAKVRASIEVCALGPILKTLNKKLQQNGNGAVHKSFLEMEMPIQRSLFLMESKGFSANYNEMFALSEQLLEIMKRLESTIYKMNCRKFNIASSVEVANVLGMRYKASTSKAALTKMADPMSDLIMQWRKLSGTLSKTVRPLLQCIQNNRIHGNSMSFTSTGRISMQEPNLQNIPKDFDVEIDSKSYSVSCRKVFSTQPGRCLISADFCQLELRILTHLSQDSALMQVMHSEHDIFRQISAKWNQIQEFEVTEKQRNDTKQICYGIIYGMGMRTLAESLKCDESTAMWLLESFHQTYPGIRSYTEKVVRFVRQEGYVETFAGRRRYLKTIHSDDVAIRAQAERQAINTTIQGSAADVAKYAILRMERNLKKYESALKVNLPEMPNSSVDLVLHLHDELFYEVPSEKAKQVAKVLKLSMENCAQLNVPLKIKTKMGQSWGEMKVIDN